MMKGGSTFAKYCRQGMSSGSRQCSSSAGNHPRVETAREVVQALPRYLLYILETVAWKSAIFYVGYKAAIHKKPFQPEKYAREIMSLSEKKQLLDVELKLLEEKEALLAQLQARRLEEKKALLAQLQARRLEETLLSKYL